MLAPLLALLLAADAPKVVKPVSLEVSSGAVQVAFETDGVSSSWLQVVGAKGFHCRATAELGRRHVLSCGGLPPDAELAFTAGAGPVEVRGTFWSPPAPGATTPFTFAVVGDSRDHLAWAQVARAIAEKHPRFVLTTGDSIQGGDSQAEWRDYFVAGQGMFASTPVFAVRGNHDLGDLYAAYNPAPPTGIGPSTYAFQYGNAGFIALDSNQPDDPRQLAFVKRALAAMKGGPLFVFQHHPLYSCGGHGSSARMQGLYQALFEASHVTYDFGGHDHDLIDWMPVNGVHYAVSGGGGAVRYPLEDCRGAAFAKESYGFVLVTVRGRRVEAVFYDDHGIELYRAPPIDAAGASIPAVDLAALARP